MGNQTAQMVGRAFIHNHKMKSGNYESTGNRLYLFGNLIAEHRNDGLWITNAGWATMTTNRALDVLPGVSTQIKKGCQYLNGAAWDGGWTKVSGTQEDSFKAVKVIAAIGEFMCNTQPEKNDWKKRVIAAGIPEASFPEDWDSLPEAEKERRLNGALAEL